MFASYKNGPLDFDWKSIVIDTEHINEYKSEEKL